MEHDELKNVWTLIKHNNSINSNWLEVYQLGMLSRMIKEVIILNQDYQELNQVSDQGKVQCADHSVLLAPISLAGPGLSLRAGGQGFSPATKRVGPSYLYWKVEEK